jgi:hypothetical protein
VHEYGKLRLDLSNDADTIDLGKVLDVNANR